MALIKTLGDEMGGYFVSLETTQNAIAAGGEWVLLVTNHSRTVQLTMEQLVHLHHFLVTSPAIDLQS